MSRVEHSIILDDGACECGLQLGHILVVIFIVDPMEVSRKSGLDRRLCRCSWGRCYRARRGCGRRGDGGISCSRGRGGCRRGRTRFGFLSFCLGTRLENVSPEIFSILYEEILQNNTVEKLASKTKKKPIL